MNDSQNLLQEALQHLRSVERQFVEIGLSPDQLAPLSRLRELLAERDQALADVAKERDRQFWSDASTLATQIRAGNKIAEISAFLRKFAEHITREVRQQASAQAADIDIAQLVDQLAEMTVDVEAER